MNLVEEVEIRHFHVCCGSGGGAKGFNRGRAEVGNMRAKFRCIGGVDSDPAGLRDFRRLAGVEGTLLDLFDREQYIAFHGHEPPAGWREATPDDMRRAAGYEHPHIIFTSSPCKGFSGLLSETKSRSVKYQALNRLALRSIWLALEAWKDDPPELFILENVPRIATRGRYLLDQITALLRHYGYAVAETTHDCGEIGGLAESRKRFLLVARHQAKVPAFLYEPPKRPLRAVGEVLGRMPLPGDMRGGPMHRLPNLQWKTWVRLAFVEAGSDWRSLNKLRVVDGKLADYLIVPEKWYGDVLGVLPWDQPSGAVIGNAKATSGAFSVADPRAEIYKGGYGVCDWENPSRTIAGESFPSNGQFAVADPRTGHEHHENVYRVTPWDRAAHTVTGASHTSGGAPTVADPRVGPHGSHLNNIYRIVRWTEPSQTITSGHGPSSGGMCVADPRYGEGAMGEHQNKMRVVDWDGPAPTITGSDRVGSGALSIADPRPGWENRYGNLSVTGWDEASKTIIGGGKGVQGGWLSVADPRAVNREKGDAYLTGGHYGVVPWDGNTGAISAAACHDNGPWSVADPRIPGQEEKLVAIIRALDGTWHRPFTTLELAAIQSLVDPDELYDADNPFDLDGSSDSAKRERIGNAVPPRAAQAIADLMGETLLRSWSGETFMLSALPIWVRPVAVALSVRVP